MSFLAPLFLLGAIAAALPILFHLIRQTTKEKTLFGSLLLLSPTPPRLTKRSRLQDILLLILRCVVVGLLAFGFARPFLSKPIAAVPIAHDGKRLMILVDTSASMRRDGLWPQAMEKTGAWLRKASPRDSIALYAFDSGLRPIFTFEQWEKLPVSERNAAALAQLKALTPSWRSSQAGAALTSAAEIAAEAGRTSFSGPKEIVLISDMQEGSRVETIQGYQWPAALKLVVEKLKPQRAANTAVQLVADTAVSDSRTAPPVRVRVSNSPDSRKEQFKLAWVADEPGAVSKSDSLDIYVPAGQSRTIVMPVSLTNKATRLVLSGDEESFDNSLFVVRPEPAALTLAYIGTEAPDNPREPLYFLSRAFPETPFQKTRVVGFGQGVPLDPDALRGASLIVATRVGEANAPVLREALLNGKTLLLSMLDAADARHIAALLGTSSLDVQEVKPANFALLAEVDLNHPLLAPFSAPAFSDFSKIRFWRHQRLNVSQWPGARVLARFDSGDPALMEVPVGRGRLLVLAAGWHPKDSQLALSTKFVPLLFSILEQSGAPPAALAQHLVGEAIALDLPDGPVQVEGPSGPPLKFDTGRTNFTGTSAPGVYRAVSSGRTNEYAVNLDPAESRHGSVAAEDLEKLGAPVVSLPERAEAIRASREIHLRNAELEARQKLWRWLVLVALGVLLIETWLSGFKGRRIVVESAKG